MANFIFWHQIEGWPFACEASWLTSEAMCGWGRRWKIVLEHNDDCHTRVCLIRARKAMCTHSFVLFCVLNDIGPVCTDVPEEFSRFSLRGTTFQFVLQESLSFLKNEEIQKKCWAKLFQASQTLSAAQKKPPGVSREKQEGKMPESTVSKRSTGDLHDMKGKISPVEGWESWH